MDLRVDNRAGRNAARLGPSVRQTRRSKARSPKRGRDVDHGLSGIRLNRVETILVQTAYTLLLRLILRRLRQGHPHETGMADVRTKCLIEDDAAGGEAFRSCGGCYGDGLGGRWGGDRRPRSPSCVGAGRYASWDSFGAAFGLSRLLRTLAQGL